MLKRILRGLRAAFLAFTLSVAGHELVLARVNVTADVWDAQTGANLGRQQTHNLVVNSGLNLLRDFLQSGNATAGVTHFAVGTGSTAVAASQTALVTEVFRDTTTSKTPSAQQLVVKYYLASGSANGSTLAEAGLFNHASAGTMYARVVLSPTIAKTTSIAVTFTWTITWGAA